MAKPSALHRVLRGEVFVFEPACQPGLGVETIAGTKVLTHHDGGAQGATRPRKGPSPPDAVQFRKGRVNLLRPRQRTAGHTGGSSCPSANCPSRPTWTNSSTRPRTCSARYTTAILPRSQT